MGSSDDEYEPDVLNGPEQPSTTGANPPATSEDTSVVENAAIDPSESKVSESEATPAPEPTGSEHAGSDEPASKEPESIEPASDAEPQDKIDQFLDQVDSEQAADAPSESNTTTETVDVAQFNAVVKFFLEGPLLQEKAFTELKPADKEYVVLKAYNDSNDTDTKVRLNFGATTSYNKPHLTSSDQYQVEVPINPFCLRPDITEPMSPEESEVWNAYSATDDSLASGRGDNFPPGSRLFIGNLAVNSLTKLDVFRVFLPYGEIKQVNIKQGFGFIQFARPEQCEHAIKGEQNVPLHNRMMHLEVSKHQVQRALEKKQPEASTRSRSRSPIREPAADRSRPPLRSSVPDVKAILTSSSTKEFNETLLERLRADGFTLNSEETTDDAANVSQESINDAAYDGVPAVVITSTDDTVNLMIFEKDEDNGIKFDEYTDISIDATSELIATAKGKKATASKRSVRPPASLPAAPTAARATKRTRSPRVRSPRAPIADKSSARKSRRKYPQPYFPSEDKEPAPYGLYNKRPQQTQQYSQPSRGYTQGYQGQGYQGHGYGQGYQPQAPPPPQPYQGYPTGPPQQAPAGDMQTVMSLMQQLQQNNNNQQQLMSMMQQFQGQQQQKSQSNVLSNLLGQLQSSTPGAAPSQPSGPSNEAAPSNPPQDNTNDLFETLARLKNNI